MIIPQLLDLSTTVSKLLIYFNINHVNDAPARQPSTLLPPSHPLSRPPLSPSSPEPPTALARTPAARCRRPPPPPPPPLPRPPPAAAVATRSARQTGNEHFDQDRSSQLPMIASAGVPVGGGASATRIRLTPLMSRTTLTHSSPFCRLFPVSDGLCASLALRSSERSRVWTVWIGCAERLRLSGKRGGWGGKRWRTSIRDGRVYLFRTFVPGTSRIKMSRLKRSALFPCCHFRFARNDDISLFQIIINVGLMKTSS